MVKVYEGLATQSSALDFSDMSLNKTGCDYGGLVLLTLRETLTVLSKRLGHLRRKLKTCIHLHLPPSQGTRYLI